MATGNLRRVFRRRFVIVSFAFFFSLVVPLSALSLCFLEGQGLAKTASRAPGSISCLDDDEDLILSPVPKPHFPELGKKASNDCHVGMLHAERSCHRVSRPSNSIPAPFSVRIYQLDSVYRI